MKNPYFIEIRVLCLKLGMKEILLAFLFFVSFLKSSITSKARSESSEAVGSNGFSTFKNGMRLDACKINSIHLNAL